jgi:hypothetical protein
MQVYEKGIKGMSKIAKIIIILATLSGIVLAVLAVIRFKQHKCGNYPLCDCFPNFPPCQWEWVRRNKLTYQFLF